MEIRDNITIKNITDEEIDNLTTTQLYNILFVPAIIAKENFEKLNVDEKNKIPVVVMGSNGLDTLLPKIVKLVDELQDINYIPKTVIFSGGIAEMYKQAKMKKNIEKLEEFKNKRRDWANAFKEVKQFGIQSIEEYFAPVSVQNLSESDILEYIFREIGAPFYTNKQREEIKIVIENQSSHTPGNVLNSKAKIDEQEIDNLKKDECVLITRWMHMTRAIFTALNQDATNNKFSKIYAIPCMDDVMTICDFKGTKNDEDFRKEAIEEIKRMRKYPDVAEIIYFEGEEKKTLADLMKMTEIREGGPASRERELAEQGR